MVVDAKYDYSTEFVEECVDLIPILENLYINLEIFLDAIKNVEVRYA